VASANVGSVARWLEQHAALGALTVGAAVVIAAEWVRGGATSGASPGWLTVEVLVMSIALVVAWHEQEQLRLTPLLAVTAAYALAVVLVHDAVGIPGDTDGAVYAAQGNELLDGDYPRSEYPVGAVLLFGLDALIGGETVRTTHSLLMIPFLLAASSAIWLLNTEWSAWLAAVFALWPADLYFVQMRFDIVVVALLLLGLLFALREQWMTAGALLGVGAAVKWSPALACALLVLWLVASRRPRDALRHAFAFVAAFVAISLPFALWQAGDVLAAYSRQSTRGITAESFPYLPLRLVGLAEPGASGEIQDPAVVPAWADDAAVVLQLLFVLAVILLVVWSHATLDGAVAAAAVAPAVFLLTNRVFSPQFALVVLGAWTVAISLLARSRAEQLLLAAVAMLATFANAMVMPGFVGSWVGWSGLYFGLSIGLTAWLLLAVVRRASDRASYVQGSLGSAAVPPTRLTVSAP
jgi:Glycosyltransferase family 87